jgi:hypothetical protein
MPLCPPQIPDDLTCARTRAAAVGCRRLTAWDMVRPTRNLTRTTSVSVDIRTQHFSNVNPHIPAYSGRKIKSVCVYICCYHKSRCNKLNITSSCRLQWVLVHSDYCFKYSTSDGSWSVGEHNSVVQVCNQANLFKLQRLWLVLGRCPVRIPEGHWLSWLEFFVVSVSPRLLG